MKDFTERDWLEQEDALLYLYDEDFNTFAPEAFTCCIELLNHNVSSAKVGLVIQTVTELCNRVPNRLPSRSMVDTFNVRIGSATA